MEVGMGLQARGVFTVGQHGLTMVSNFRRGVCHQALGYVGLDKDPEVDGKHRDLGGKTWPKTKLSSLLLTALVS